MTDVFKALQNHGESARAVVELLYGDGAWEITKAMTDRNKRRVTAGLSAVGATAGAAGLGYAGLKTGQAYKAAQGASKLGRLGSAVKHEKFGSALIPLEVAGLGGELMATKILHGDTKKHALHRQFKDSSADYSPVPGKKKAPKIPVAKAEQQVPYRHGKLTTISYATDKGFNGLKKLPGATQKVKGTATRVIQKNFDVVWRGEISKMDTDQRQVFGWASIVEMDGEPVVDRQGDYISVDEIEKAAYNYVLNSRKGGNQHAREGESPRQVSSMIESFLVTPEKKEALGLPEKMPTGWWVGFKINDEDTWQEVKSGAKTDFSIHGSGIKKDVVV